MPQVYWMKANGTVPSQLARTIREYEELTSIPMIPTGAAFSEHGWTAIPSDQKIFIEEVKQHNLSGCNWWEYYYAFERFPELGQAIIETPFGVEDLDPINPEPEETFPFWAICTAKGALRIRTSPEVLIDNTVGYLLNGEKRLIYDKSGSWWKIDEERWVSSNYMTRLDDPVDQPLSLEDRVKQLKQRVRRLEQAVFGL